MIPAFNIQAAKQLLQTATTVKKSSASLAVHDMGDGPEIAFIYVTTAAYFDLVFTDFFYTLQRVKDPSTGCIAKGYERDDGQPVLHIYSEPEGDNREDKGKRIIAAFDSDQNLLMAFEL